jgi:hypothetical protein
MTARARTFWTDSLGRADRTYGCSVNMKAAGPAESYVTDYAPWLQKMTAEAEQKLATLEPADAAAVRADELKKGLAPAVRTTRKPLTPARKPQTRRTSAKGRCTQALLK